MIDLHNVDCMESANQKRSASLKSAHTQKQWGFKKGERNPHHSWTGRKHTEATKAKMRAARLKNQPMHRAEVVAKSKKTKLISGSARGANNPNWQGGITRHQVRIRNSKAYSAWRTTVFVRDEYTCQQCGARCGCGVDVKLNAHHIKSFSKHPELRLDITNGVTLCKPCHDAIPKGNQHYAND